MTDAAHCKHTSTSFLRAHSYKERIEFSEAGQGSGQLLHNLSSTSSRAQPGNESKSLSGNTSEWMLNATLGYVLTICIWTEQRVSTLVRYHDMKKCLC